MPSILTISVEFVLGLLLWPTLTLLLGPIFGILIFLRVIVNILASLQNLTPIPHGEQLYTCPDGEIWALLTGALKLQQQINVPALRKHFQETFLQNGKDSRFYKEVVHFLGYGFTRRVQEIDLEFHIREIEMEKEEKGCNFNSILTKLWMDNSSIEQKPGVGLRKPPWEILVGNYKDGSIIVVKIHHCLADGYSLVSIIDQLTGNKSPYIVKPWVISPWRKFKILWNLPLGLMKQIYNFDAALAQHPFSLKVIEPKPTKPLIPLITSTVTLDFKKMKTIRKMTGTRMLPIFLCLHVEAVKRFLKETGRIDGDETKYNKYFRHILNLPKPEHPAIRENKFCNHMIMGAGKVALTEQDLIQRLQLTNQDFESYQENDEEKIASILSPIPYLLPTCLIRHFQDLSKYPLFSTISTLILSPTRYSLLGTNITNLYFGTTFDTKCAGLRGVMMFTFTKGDEVDACIVGSMDLFHNQSEIDYYAEKLLPNVLDDYWKLCVDKEK